MSPLGFKARVGSALFELSRGMCYITHSPRFTSDATPADLLAASMAAMLSLPHTCKALVGLETRSYHAAAHSVRSGRPDTLPTELSRLGYVILFLFLGIQCHIETFRYQLARSSRYNGHHPKHRNIICNLLF